MNYPQDQLLKTMRELDPLNASATDEELLSPAFQGLQNRAKLNLALANVAKTFDEAFTPALLAGIEVFQSFGAEVIKAKEVSPDIPITAKDLTGFEQPSPFHLYTYQKTILAPYLSVPEDHQVRLTVKGGRGYLYATKDGLNMTHQWDGQEWKSLVIHDISLYRSALDAFTQAGLHPVLGNNNPPMTINEALELTGGRLPPISEEMAIRLAKESLHSLSTIQNAFN